MNILFSEIKFNNYRNQILNLYAELEQILEDESFFPRVRAAQERLQRDRMNLLVVGEFSRGKSTFINALLGYPVLPSKVNPTTATINLIEGHHDRKMIINYHDGTAQAFELPAEKTNHFLDSYLTSGNAEANKIKEVFIAWPGKLEQWKCLIVDTPGVNDLDDLREEITYSYLAKADACIVILDSQQPLSESERRFINEKVLANDIKRLLFVINRIDEVDAIPGGENAIRITNYVKRLIKEHLPSLQDPQIFSVSSKEALRARFKCENSLWEESFSDFEKSLLEFISFNASKGRLPNHLDRYISIAEDFLFSLEEQRQILEASGLDLEKKILRLKKKEQYLNTQLLSMSAVLDREVSKLSYKIQDESSILFSQLKDNLLASVENCENNDDLIRLKTQLNTGIRSSVEILMNIIVSHKKQVAAIFSEHFSEYFDDHHSFLPEKYRSYSGDINFSDMQLALFPEETKEASKGIESLITQITAGGITGLTIGHIFAAILGPLTIVAGMLGAGLIGGKIEEFYKKREMEQAKGKTLDQIRGQLDATITSAEAQALQMARLELEPLEKEFREKINSRVKAIHETLQKQKSGLGREISAISNVHSHLLEKVNRNKELLTKAFEMRRTIEDGNPGNL